MKSFAVLPLCLAMAVSSYAQVSVTTSRNDNNRDGQNLNETTLTPSNVNVTHFGRLFTQLVDGWVYAQPLYVPSVTIPGLGTHNVIYVATERDSIYAFDADSDTGINGSPLWRRSFINTAKGISTLSTTDVNCTDIVPEIGITGTPVIDPSTKTMFVVVRTKENGSFYERLHALNITDGKDQANSPVVIDPQTDGTGDGSVNGVIKFNSVTQGQRAGLLLLNGTVFIGFGSLCDNSPYHGWVMGYDETTLQRTSLFITTPNAGLGGVWQAGTGLATDGTYVYFASGNGGYDGPGAGDDYGDTVVKLTVDTYHSHPADFFTPYNQALLAEYDTDTGSGGVLLLPDQTTGPYPHLLIQVGKVGAVYLINRDHMGHYGPVHNHIVQDLETATDGVWGTPGWWNNNVYFGAQNDYVRQFTFDPTTGLLSGSAVALSPTYYNFPGPTPSISANGDSDAILWTIQTDQYYTGGPAILHAYDATNVATELYNSTQNATRDNPGAAVKFAVPTIANGKVYVGTETQVSVYGLLSSK
jgi:hypothetical protein